MNAATFPKWSTRQLPDRSGAFAYVIVIRHPKDPERSPRPKHGRQNRAPHLTIAKTSAKVWAKKILELLADGKPRTFNAIGVTLIDKTADIILGSNVELGLWSCVADGLVEYTMQAPVQFRIVGGAP